MNNLRIYEDAKRLVVLCRPHWEKLAACGQREEASQLRRSAPSVPRNIAEGTGRYDGNGRQRFETASGSARETIATLEIAVAMGVLEQTEVDEAIDCADKIIATLWSSCASEARNERPAAPARAGAAGGSIRSRSA